MNNAFNILGAEPTDTAERLQELLDEKELLVDDASEVQAAYADLTNPKKRVQHEILYFCSDALEDFNKLVNRDFEETPTIGQIANIVVELGWWFEFDDDELFERINTARGKSGFTQIEDVDIVSQAVQSLKQDCIQSVNTYFDGLKEKSLVGIFNQIVKIEDYESFFIDELVAHYELVISETISTEQSKCENYFTSIEKLCRQFINGSDYPYSVKSEYAKFEKALLYWDSILQPLQVNAQIRGASHKTSAEFVHDLRNKVISLCNDSQAALNELVEALQYTDFNSLMANSRFMNQNQWTQMFMKGIEARNKLPQKVAESVELTDLLFDLLKLFKMVFAEIEQTAEQLTQDIDAITNLRDTLKGLKRQVDPSGDYDRFKEQKTSNPASSTQNYTQYKQEKQKQSELEERQTKYNIWFGILAVVLLIMFIVGFTKAVIVAGVIGLIAFVVSGILLVFNNNKKDYEEVVFKATAWIVTVAAVVVAIILLSNS